MADSIAKQWEDAKTAQKQTVSLLSEMLDAITKQIRAKDLPGVKTHGNFATISFSCLGQNDSILSPSYYSQEEQTSLVRKKLKRYVDCADLLGFQQALQAMADSGKVTIKNQSDRLNPNTLTVLRTFLDRIS